MAVYDKVIHHSMQFSSVVCSSLGSWEATYCFKRPIHIAIPWLTVVSTAGGVASLFLRTKRHLSQLDPSLPKMLILGDQDQFSSASSMQKVFRTQQADATQYVNAELQIQPVPVCFVLMTDCDHFFVNHRKQMAERVLQFCTEQFSNGTKL